MPNYTSNLNLFKYDLINDAQTAFSIEQALNNNWDKIDVISGPCNDIVNCNTSTISLQKDKLLYEYIPTGTTSFVFNTSNLSLSSDMAYTFELIIIMNSVYALSFPCSWGKIIGSPNMTNTGIYFFAFRTIDAGSTWKGSLQDVWS